MILTGSIVFAQKITPSHDLEYTARLAWESRMYFSSEVVRSERIDSFEEFKLRVKHELFRQVYGEIDDKLHELMRAAHRIGYDLHEFHQGTETLRVAMELQAIIGKLKP